MLPDLLSKLWKRLLDRDLFGHRYSQFQKPKGFDETSRGANALLCGKFRGRFSHASMLEKF